MRMSEAGVLECEGEEGPVDAAETDLMARQMICPVGLGSALCSGVKGTCSRTLMAPRIRNNDD